MGVDHRFAARELFEHGIESRIAEPLIAIAGEEHDAVGFQHIETVFDLLEAGIDIRQRQVDEHAEALGMVGDQLGCVIVAQPRQLLRRGDVAEP